MTPDVFSIISSMSKLPILFTNWIISIKNVNNSPYINMKTNPILRIPYNGAAIPKGINATTFPTRLIKTHLNPIISQ